MVSADPATPEPTYGSPTISSMPCSFPSSPNGPCSIGSTTSIGPASSPAVAGTPARPAGTSARPSDVPGSSASRPGSSAGVPAASAGRDDSSICQPPARSICTGTTS